MSTHASPLRRMPEDGMVSGVCAGLADRLDVDVSIVRAAFVGLVVFSGFGLVVYLALWVLLDPVVATDGPSADRGQETADEIEGPLDDDEIEASVDEAEPVEPIDQLSQNPISTSSGNRDA